MIEQVSRLLPDVVLRWYLLGGLRAPLRGILEWLYFLSDDLHQRLEVVEAELVDDYVYGRLSARQSPLFENAYLTSAGRRDNVAITEALRDYPFAVAPRSGVPRVHEKRVWLSRWSVVAAGLCLMTVGGWIIQVSRQTVVFTIVLTPELSGPRSPTDAKDPFFVPRGVQRVIFEIHTRETRLQGYSAVLKINRTVVETIPEIKISNRGALTFDIPITNLKTGTYTLELIPVNGAPSTASVEDFRFELIIRS